MSDELAKLRNPDDISDSDAEKYLHYQQLTLEDPDEVWLDETETGERHFTFISQFSHGDKKIYYVVVCLALDGSPSFVFLRFPTRDENLVDEYRRGTDMRIEHDEIDPNAPDTEAMAEPAPPPEPPEFDEDNPDEDVDSREPNVHSIEDLSGPVSDVERLYAELRQPGDIPREDFYKYESFIEPTLDDPDEIWQFIDGEGNEWYTFISRQRLSDDMAAADESVADEFTMIVVCEPLFDENSQARNFEVIFAFPSIDPGLVQHFRKGICSLNKTFGTGWAGRRAA